MIVNANCQRAATTSAMPTYNRPGLMKRARRLLIVLCLFAVLLGALLAPVTGWSAPAVLVPLAPLFGFVLLLIVGATGDEPAYAYLATPPGPSRAPPATA